MPISSWKKAKKTLCVRLDTVGDVLMTSPAFRALRESGNRPALTLLTSSIGAAIGRLIPEIDEVLTYDCPWMKATEPRRSAEIDGDLIARLKAERFDAAVIFTVFSQNPLPAALLCYLAEIPLRLAYCRENPYQLLSDWVPEQDSRHKARHEVRRQLDLVAAVGASTRNERLSLYVPKNAVERVQQVLRKTGIDLNGVWVVVHPGASAPSRRYPSDKFAEVAGLVLSELGAQVVFTGAASEMALVQDIRQKVPHRTHSVAGLLSLAELAALVRLAPLLISNNTGPVHIAAALGTPVVDIYALTNPQHTPWGVESRVLFHDVPCKNCFKSVCPEGHHHCLTLVTPRAVLQATRDLLEKRVLELARG
ncbi:MAG: lipopolysaccharide heptosyltransferase II [Acidobacteriota bacterium]